MLNPDDAFQFESLLTDEDRLIMEAAREYAQSKLEPRALEGNQDEIFHDEIPGEMAELGLLGSRYFVEHPPAGLELDKAVAMVNMDMVGRMRDGKVSVLGGATAQEWKKIVGTACDEAAIRCTIGGSGYGPSDQMSFYGEGMPVLQFFTGAHGDYHKTTDDSSLVHAAGWDHVTLVGSNADDTVAFYRDVLELPVLFALDRDDSVLTGFDLAGAYLLVEPGGVAKTPESFPDEAQVRLRFNVADLDAAIAELRGKGVAVARLDHSWGSVGLFRDPDGNLCQLRGDGRFGE